MKDHEISRIQMLKIILKHGVDVNAKYSYLENVHHKVESPTDDPRDPEYISGIELIPDEGTALHLALKHKHEEIVSLLIFAGADKSIPREFKGNISVNELADSDHLKNALIIRWTPKNHYLHDEILRKMIKTTLLCAHRGHWNIPNGVLFEIFDFLAKMYYQQKFMNLSHK